MRLWTLVERDVTRSPPFLFLFSDFPEPRNGLTRLTALAFNGGESSLDACLGWEMHPCRQAVPPAELGFLF